MLYQRVFRLKSKFWQQSPTPKKRFLGWILFLILGLGICLRFYFEIQKVDRAGVVESWDVSQSADCAVVLTGGPGRIREGLDLLYNHKVRKLIISGVNANSHLKEIAPNFPFYGDLSEEDIILEKRSETTFGNAVQSLPIVEALQCRDILLVTSRLHMYRSLRTFQAIYPGRIEIIPHSIVGTRYRSNVWEQTVEASKSLFYSLWTY